MKAQRLPIEQCGMWTVTEQAKIVRQEVSRFGSSEKGGVDFRLSFRTADLDVEVNARGVLKEAERS